MLLPLHFLLSDFIPPLALAKIFARIFSRTAGDALSLSPLSLIRVSEGRLRGDGERADGEGYSESSLALPPLARCSPGLINLQGSCARGGEDAGKRSPGEDAE